MVEVNLTPGGFSFINTIRWGNDGLKKYQFPECVVSGEDGKAAEGEDRDVTRRDKNYEASCVAPSPSRSG
jgi:hypothetical protein